MVGLIDEGYEASSLPDAHKAILAFADAFLGDPASIPPATRTAMAEHFSAAEITELALALTLFLGMSKVLISLGLEPDQMDTLVLPTPSI
ncbi:MAG: carboxymuconolactone decarboxylase family protein [Acidimicrobiales bacterium]